MNRTIYLRKGEPRIKWKHLVMELLLLFVFTGSMVFGQSTDSFSVVETNPEVVSLAANGLYLTVISVIVAILAILTMIAILIPTVVSFIQIRRVEREWKRFIEMVEVEWKQRTNKLHESIKQFSHPAEILKEAAEKAEAIAVTEVKGLREFISVFEENQKEQLNKLQSGVEKEKAAIDELTATVNSVKLELEKKPSTSDILVQVGDKYKVPDDLMEIVLQKVGLALLCLRNLTKEERKEIIKVLTENPRISDKKD